MFYGDRSREHGTHVCGTIAGFRAGGNLLASGNGAAPGAKISFMDLQSMQLETLSVPKSIETELLLVSELHVIIILSRFILAIHEGMCCI